MSTELVTSIALLVNLVIWVLALRDCYYHAKVRKELWMVIIIIAGPLGWAIFYFSPDRN